MNREGEKRIETITLEGMLPKVFLGEAIPSSGVWRNHIEFRRGLSYRIEASSGAGKTSLCAYICGLRHDYEGRLLFNGVDAGSFSLRDWLRLRRCNISYLPQDLELFPELTAMENICLKNSLTHYADESEIEEWLFMLGVDSRRDTPACRLSAGQRQRVALVRALCQPFDFLLLDEPVSHLDFENNRIAAEIIAAQAAKRGAGVIATSVGNPILLQPDETLRL